MSSQNDTIVDTSSLTHEDLLDAYEKLAQSYGTVKRELDEVTQKYYTKSQQNKIYENSLNDLQSELDQINSINAEKLLQCEKRSEELKERNIQLTMENQSLEDKIDNFGSTIKELKTEVESLRGLLSEKTHKPRISDAFMKNLEAENEELRIRRIDLEIQLQMMSDNLTKSNESAEMYKEKIQCLEENLESKKAELDEKMDMIDQMQEKMHEMRTELDKFTNMTLAVDEGNRKGNSLFAEVDDQRQKMKQILQSERNDYLSMKKAFNAKEMEIRRLKRENLNIKSEIQSCSSLLTRGESLITQNLNQYVARLENEKKLLVEQLKEMETRMIDIATTQKLTWIQTLMTSSSKDVRESKDKVFVLMREKTSAIDNFAKATKDLARMKLEVVKYKTLLGHIVNEFKLKIQPEKFSDIGICDDFLESLRYEHFDLEEITVNEETSEYFDMTTESSLAISSTMRDQSPTPSSSSSVVAMDIGNEIKCKIEKQSPEMKKPTTAVTAAATVEDKKSPVLKEKMVQFASETQTKVIDSTQESFDESRLARKRTGFTVKRFVIPSKTAKKENL